MHSGKIRKQRRANRILERRFYALLSVNLQLEDHASPAKFVVTNEGNAGVRGWKTGRGKVIQEIAEVTLSNAVALLEQTQNAGYYIVNPNTLELCVFPTN